MIVPMVEGLEMTTWQTESAERRRELGLRQVDLASLAGVSERFVRQLEGGKASLRLDKVEQVLDVLGLELTSQPRPTP